MRIVRVTPPAVEPILIADANLQLKLEGDAATADAPLVNEKIGAARVFCEGRSHLAFVTQTYDLFLDAWGDRRGSNPTGHVGWSTASGATVYNNAWRANQVDFPINPVQSVSFVRYTDQGGNVQTWDPSNYKVGLGLPGRLAPAQNVCFPAAASQIDAVQVRVVAGYGADGTSTPAAAISAMKLVMAWLYENRAPAAFELTAVDSLLNSVGCGNNLFS